MIVPVALLTATVITSVNAASAADWRSRSIYQVITDRFAPPSADAPALSSGLPSDYACVAGSRAYCGGNWRSIIDKLDYIQAMGFDAIWISPISMNIDYNTHWGYGYHGYWVNDPTQLNYRFGDTAAIQALSSALHSRGMYLMVDIVINDVAATSTDIASAVSTGGYLFTSSDYYHPFCWVDYTNQTSMEYCCLGDINVPLLDVDTENTYVISTLQTWIKNAVSTYGIDGLRLDAARHIPKKFWQSFCAAAGVFCMGEVFSSNITYASGYQSSSVLDSVEGYPLYFGLTAAFSPTKNMASFISYAQSIPSGFSDSSVLGNFLENHDNPRFRNVTSDAQQAYNALVGQFLFDGIPIVYNGQEQEISFGAEDPYNRNAIWEYGYGNTTTLTYITNLNKIRSALIASGVAYDSATYLNAKASVISTATNDVAIRKGPIVMSLTNRGASASTGTFIITSSGMAASSTLVDLLTCQQFTANSDSSITVSYSSTNGYGRPYVFAALADAQLIGLCGTAITGTTSNPLTGASTTVASTVTGTTTANAGQCTCAAT